MNVVSKYHIRKGDISAMVSLTKDSAKVLNKFGADRFEEVSIEADYFMHAVNYHTSMLDKAYKNVVQVDKLRQKEAETTDKVIMEGWRPDVLAAVFEFDSLLVCTRALLDRLVQVLKTPINQTLPKSITDLIKKYSQLKQNPLANLLISAWEGWGKKVTDYRDCLLHYWTFYEGLNAIFNFGEGREILIPDNPEANTTNKFIYDKKISLINYAKEINNNCQILTQSLFRQIFELLLKEEFGEGVKITYWDVIPKTDNEYLLLIKRKYSIELSPGLAVDNIGNKFRIKRILKL